MSGVKRVGCWLVFVLLVTGCMSHVQYLPRADTDVLFRPLNDRDDVVVGVALSGGGSRAAVFGAGGLEALATVRSGKDHRSLLERISYMSSVSGGSLSATYFAMHKPSHEIPVLTPEGTLTNQYRGFFDRYKEAMSQDFEIPVELRQFFKIRWFNPTQRATSLAEVLDHRFLNNLTIEDLYKREAVGDSPRLLINSTLYNNGRRFVMTTLPQEAFNYNFLNKLKITLTGAVSSRPEQAQWPPSLIAAEEHITPLTFSSEEIKADPRRVPLSVAVAASASFPPLIGPITAQVAGSKEYWHAGDGGLFDNQGTESLAQVMLKKLEERTVKRALIIAFDSSYPFSVGGEQLTQNPKGFDVFVEDPSRITGIMEERANMYQALVWHILQMQKIVLPDDRVIKVIVLRHIEAEWNEDASDLPYACRAEAIEWTPKKIKAHLTEIPTLLRIRSECDKQLLLAAAAKVVVQKEGEIKRFLDAE